MAESESMAEIGGCLECPVCYKIPRELPVPCCDAGHIVCQPCKGRVTNCPTCRGKMKSNTSTVVGNLIMLVSHKCKFSSIGCDVKMKLKDIEEHEKHCPESTDKCPENECNEKFQLKNFDQHTLAKHSLECCFKNGGQYFVPKEDIDRFSMLEAWKFKGFLAHNFLFHLMVTYSASEQFLRLYVILAQDEDIVSKFTYK